MVAEQPCEVQGQAVHPGAPLDNDHVQNQISPSEKNCEIQTSSAFVAVDYCAEQIQHYLSAGEEIVPQSIEYSSVSVKNDVNDTNANVVSEQEVFCDTNGYYNLNGIAVCSDLKSFQSNTEKSDTVSTNSDLYSNSDYTDSVCSADSTTFLLPKPVDKDEVCVTVTLSDCQSNPDPVVECTPTDIVVEANECYENKDYTDSVSSGTSNTLPLLNRAESMWSFIKEVDVSAPVIGLIDHPGFISSQKDLSSTSNLSFACQKALKYLQDERIASSLLLPGSAKDVSKLSPEDWKAPEDIDHNIVPSGRHTRNLIFLSICNTMVFIACGSLRNLQSSINHESGVGITSLAVSCFGFVIGSLFSPFLVQNFDPYRCLLASLLPHAMYIGANFYPVMWLMVPVSFIQGVSGAVWWNAMSTYVTFLAKGYAEKRKKDYEGVLNKFFSIFCLVYQMYMIFGNLIASLVLTYANPLPTDLSNVTSSNNTFQNFNSNQSESMYLLSDDVAFNSTSPSAFNTSSSPFDITLCGANYCHHYTIQNTGTVVSNFARYLLFGIYIVCMVISLLIVLFLLEPLNKRLFSSSVMTCGMVKSQLVSIGQFMINRKFLLLIPLLLFSSMEQGFATAEITKAFITCPIGVHMVGYAMICMGVSSSISAFLSGWLTRFMGRTAVFGLVVVLNLGLLAFIAIWPPTADSLVVILVLIGLWGFADGIWLAQTSSLMGVLFPLTFEEAFTGLRIMQGLGSTIAFGYAQVFCMASKIYIMSTVCVVGMACYLVSEHLLKKEQRGKTKIVYIEEV